jgi:hypothetical protein
MANDSSDGPTAEPPAARPAQPSPGGLLLLALACLPYVILVGMLPDATDFPGEGGGEAQMGWGFQQFWDYTTWAVILTLLWLALWRASLAGGISGGAVPVLVLAAGAAMLFAIAQSFEQPGPWLPLVPILLPPVMAVYALWGCLPVLSGWLASGLQRTKIDRAATGLIVALSLMVIPLWLLDDASYPRRLERHRAELAAADVAARAAGEQEDRALRAKFARLGPDSSLRDYIEARSWFLNGVDILGGERQVKSRQSDAVAMLDQGMILDLSNLWQLDLEPTAALCQSYGRALAAVFGQAEKYRGSPYLSLMEAQVPNIRWLRDAHCDLDGPLAEIDARLGFMLESKDPSGAPANDTVSYYSRWDVSRDTVEAMRVKLASFRGAR